MRAGKLRDRIRIEERTVTRGASGGIKTAWATYWQCWAQRRDMSGSERSASSAAGGQVAVARVEFLLRERAGISTQMRVVDGTQLLGITHVKPLADYPGWMVLTCDTGLNDG
ncbi:head-tail adaptor protein [Melaminivora sp.]|uniref:head-tail adaptor protein n=1 Tax=Melaminivora sp. TaxID=1933032 RepID=UPI0028AD8511|nr:head-tail adaptor protein [Melaminivora sp.]